MPSIILLSGPIASGKTTLAAELIESHGFHRLKSSDYLKALCATRGLEISRANLQKVGDELDSQTDYRWLVSEIAAPRIASTPDQNRWLIDAVRKGRQIEHFRAAFGPEVLHVHVWASEEVLKDRYYRRHAAGESHEGSTSYGEAIAHPNEIASRDLMDHADLAINVHRVSTAATASAIAMLVS